jgi:hypothetical protein
MAYRPATVRGVSTGPPTAAVRAAEAAASPASPVAAAESRPQRSLAARRPHAWSDEEEITPPAQRRRIASVPTRAAGAAGAAAAADPVSDDDDHEDDEMWKLAQETKAGSDIIMQIKVSILLTRDDPSLHVWF